MGKKWDYDVPSVEVWQEVLRVLKPGGYLLSFAGTRTQHRMAVRIEDAGFEIRDMIAWVYGCLSFDTEVLTERGFRLLHKLTQYDRIVVYDIEKNIYKWERPQRWNIYQVNEDTAYRIKSDYTDQIVSRNHRCLVEREGKLVFIQAEELLEMEYMPTLQSDFFALQKGHWKLLLSDLLWQSKGLAQKIFSKWFREEVSSEGFENGKESSLEGWRNIFQKARKLQTNKVCAMSEAVFSDGTKRRLCDGTSFDFSKLNGALPIENGSGASHQPQSTRQPIGKSDAIQIKQGTQITRRARVEKIKYSGIIFCPTVSTGAFIARRNGQVFITGNSGFPKSLNIGKAVKALQETGGSSPRNLRKSRMGNDYEPTGQEDYRKGRMFSSEIENDDTKEEINNEWEGWGTALKPSHEDITVAQKPYTNIGDYDIMVQRIISNLCQLPSLVSIVKKNFPLSQNVLGEGLSIAQWIAENNTNTQDALSVLMATLQSELETNSSLNTELSWLNILGVLLKNGNTYTTETKTSLIIDLQTLNSLLSQITLSTTIKGETRPNGDGTNVLIVDSFFNVLGLKLKTIHELFAGDCAISQAGEQGLRPKLEPITVARKPLEGTVAENCLKWGTGGINIDESRVNYTSEKDKEGAKWGNQTGNINDFGKGVGDMGGKDVLASNLGRFPANLIHDNSEEVRECFPETKGGGSQRGSRKWKGEDGEGGFGGWAGKVSTDHYVSRDDGTGNASRFFKSIIYQAKASKSERNRGCEGLPLGEAPASARSKPAEGRENALGEPRANNHPTVKPIALMEYLVKLVTKPNHIVIDPFTGSGSTLIACKNLGRRYIGIERESEYCKIAETRLAAVKTLPVLF